MADDDGDDRVKHIVTMQSMLRAGLNILYTAERIERVKNHSTNNTRFRLNYGVSVGTLCQVYEDMQRSEDASIHVEGCDRVLKELLITFYFLRNYPKLHELESKFDYSPGWISQKIWDMVKRLQAMQSIKIEFPSDEDVANDIWIMTVDGTHVWVLEPSHPEFSQDPKAYSHKYNKSAKSYELGIALTGGLIWMNGPFEGGTNDITMAWRPEGTFREHGEESDWRPRVQR